VVIALLFAQSWTGATQELIRQDDLFQKGHVEVTIEGISEKSLRDAEDDAKRKALEKANGLFINYQRSNREENVTTMDSESMDFSNRQEDNTGLSMTGDANFVSIDYLERAKRDDGLYHVTIKAVVKIKGQK
jgi:hypothetical protein